MLTRKEIEKQIDFNVDDEAVLDEFFTLQHQAIEAAINSGMISGGIQFNTDSMESTNRMTLYYVIEKLNLTNAVRYFLENYSELPDNIYDLLFQISSKILVMIASKAPEHVDLSTQAIIHEIVCEELAKEIGPSKTP